MLDLYPIKNRLGKITPGVWRYHHVDQVIRKALGDAAANALWFEDADLIARAPQDLAALVTEVEHLRASIINQRDYCNCDVTQVEERRQCDACNLLYEVVKDA